MMRFSKWALWMSALMVFLVGVNANAVGFYELKLDHGGLKIGDRSNGYGKFVVNGLNGNTTIAGTLGISGGMTFSSTLGLTLVNSSGGSANPFDYTGTLGIMDGSDTFQLFDVNITNANHTGSSNVVEVLNVAGITGDADAQENCITIGSGWDVDINSATSLELGADDTAVVTIKDPAAAGSGQDLVDITATLAAMDGSDTSSALNIAITNADHASTGNAVNGVNIAGITGDAECTETAVKVGTGWDYALDLGAGICLQNDETIGNGTNGTIDFTAGVLKHAYDAAAYWTATQADAGSVTFDSVSDGTPAFNFSDVVNIGGGYGDTGASISAAGVGQYNGALTTDGALNSDSIACTNAATFGGGYGSTGATISTAGVGQFNGALTTDGSFTADSGAFGGGYGSTGASISNAGVGQFNGALTTDGALTADSGVFGGGYGSTGATISTAGVGQFNGALTTDGVLTAASAEINGTITLANDETISNGTDGIVEVSAASVKVNSQPVVLNTRHRVTIAEINAGHELLPAIAGRTYRLIECKAIAYGGSVGACTTVDLLGTQSSSGVKLVAYAQASLTQSTVLTDGGAGAAVLADGASYIACDANTAITVGKTGSDVTTATGVDFILTYAIE